MAVTTGDEFDHITISNGTDQIVHYLKDPTARTLIENKADKNNTVLTGSISLGRKTDTAIGTGSSAVGSSCTASGFASHAEGLQTTAIGNQSHSEGSHAAANGSGSHAEGSYTIAAGNYSHAEGEYTIAKGLSQHVFGGYNIEDLSPSTQAIRGNYVEIVGNGTADDARSNARTLDWSGNERLAGGLTLGAGTANETSITASELANIKSGGSGTTDYTDLTNKPQIAGTTLTGNKSLDDLGIAAKNNVVLTGTLSKGRKANTTSGTDSVALGEEVEASGNYAVAMGYGTVSSGTHSFAEGSFATSSASYSHAEGRNTNATAMSSHAEGNGTTASGQYCHAEGDQTTASRNAAHAEGANTSADGTASHAEGGTTVANGNYSHSEGYHTAAYGKCTHVFGEYNTYNDSASRSSRSTYVEIVGNGTAEDARSDARTLDWSGNESLAGGLTLGKGTADETSITASELAGIKDYIEAPAKSLFPESVIATPLDYESMSAGTYHLKLTIRQIMPSGKKVISMEWVADA